MCIHHQSFDYYLSLKSPSIPYFGSRRFSSSTSDTNGLVKFKKKTRKKPAETLISMDEAKYFYHHLLR